MKKSAVTFDELRHFLLHLGFREIPEKARMCFEHPSTELLFRRYRSRERVNERDMFLVRTQLVYNGLIEESDFDRFLQKASA